MRENAEQYMDSEEKEWVNLRNRAKARQEAVHQSNPMGEKEQDAIRRKHAEANMAAARARATTPSSLSKQSEEIDFTVSIPKEDPDPDQKTPYIPNTPNVGPSPTGISTAPGNSILCIWECKLDNETIYASSWDALKDKLKLYSGLWTATEHKFTNTIDNILGFFVPTQHNTLKNDTTKSFDIIVQNGKVFKGES
jgi:hypothetical protein